MHKIIADDGSLYSDYSYANENEYEKIVVSNAETIFGQNGIYFDIKKRIGKSNEGAAIPDGYYLDLKFHNEPVLYFVEIELSSHDLYGHIGEQVLRFSISSEMSKHRIKTILKEDIESDSKKKEKVDDFLKKSTKFTSSVELLDKLIFDSEVAVIIVIDDITEHLTRVLSKIKITADIIEVQSYVSKGKLLHRYTPFQEDLIEATIEPVTLNNSKEIKELPANNEYDELDTLDILDTIVIPMKNDVFNQVYLGQNCWIPINISAIMLDKLKYVAAYQTAPVSAITYIAEIDRFEKCKDSNKYIIYFKEKAHEIRKVPFTEQTKGSSPQYARYASYSKLKRANNLEELWK